MLKVWGLQINSHYTVTLPVSLGTLWSYLSTREDIFKHLQLTGFGLRFQDTVLELLEEMEESGVPDVILVSMYMWNRNRSNKLTRAIKEKYPHIKIIVGGNDVPQEPKAFEGFVAENSQYDYFVWSEGEVACEMIFRKILSEKGIYTSDYFDDCFSQARDGIVIKSAERRRYLEHKGELDFPSPSAMGLYDDIVEKYKDVEIQSILETNRGCPYSCTFCDWGLEEKIRKFSLKRIKDEIDWMVGNVNEIMIADANFGILKRDLDIAKYLVKAKMDHPSPRLHSTAITYSKNAKERVLEIANILERFDFSRSGATFSLQSLNLPTLEAIKRKNMSISKNFPWIMDNFTKRHIPYYNELILGLPLETIETFFAGLDTLLEYNPLEINIYKLARLENSEINLADHEKIYDIKWDKFEQGPSQHEDEKEWAYIVSSTSTMSSKDMMYSRRIRDMVQVMWLGKSLYFAGRYLQKEYGIKPTRLLRDFEKWQEKNNPEFWNVFYESLEDIRGQGNSGRKPVPLWYDYGTSSLKFHRYVNAWLYLNGDENRKNLFYSDFTTFCLDNYNEVPEEIILDLVNFNSCMVIDSRTQFEFEFETQFSWINYFMEGTLDKVPTKYEMKIDRVGNAKHPVSIGQREAFYFIAGGHEFMFNKQNAFTYQFGGYQNIKQGRVEVVSRVGCFFRKDSVIDLREVVLKEILAKPAVVEDAILQKA